MVGNPDGLAVGLRVGDAVGAPVSGSANSMQPSRVASVQNAAIAVRHCTELASRMHAGSAHGESGPSPNKATHMGSSALGEALGNVLGASVVGLGDGADVDGDVVGLAEGDAVLDGDVVGLDDGAPVSGSVNAQHPACSAAAASSWQNATMPARHAADAGSAMHAAS